jgi:hypothetical protein
MTAIEAVIEGVPTLSVNHQVAEVLNALGGPTVVSRKLTKIMNQTVPQSTVGRWRQKGDIPPPWRYIIRSHASELGWASDTIPQCLQPTLDW